MGTRNIRVDDDAYERLVRRKREGESFSDVIKREFSERSLSEVAGILSDAEADEFERAIADARERDRARVERLADRMRSDRAGENGSPTDERAARDADGNAGGDSP